MGGEIDAVWYTKTHVADYLECYGHMIGCMEQAEKNTREVYEERKATNGNPD